MYITFSHSTYLLLLFVIPLFILIRALSLKSIKRKALNFANFEAISRIKGIDFFSKNLATFLLNLVIIFLMIMAVSGLTLHKQADASSLAFVLAIDSSRSMEAQDMQPNRIEAAKEVAKNFVDSSPLTTKIGIVSFSGTSYINQEITDDKIRAKEAIDSVEISSVEGTDIFEVVVTSTNLLQNEEGKCLVLLSDGQITYGEIQNAISYANENNVIINTIAIGTTEGGKIFYGVSKLDEDSLKALAYNTQGNFSKAADKETLSDSFNSMLKLTKMKVSIELSSYLLLAAIILFLISYALTEMRYRIFP